MTLVRFPAQAVGVQVESEDQCGNGYRPISIFFPARLLREAKERLPGLFPKDEQRGGPGAG